MFSGCVVGCASSQFLIHVTTGCRVIVTEMTTLPRRQAVKRIGTWGTADRHLQAYAVEEKAGFELVAIGSGCPSVQSEHARQHHDWK